MAGVVLLSGCATGPQPTLKNETGESVVFVGEQPAFLAWLPARDRPLRVRSTYLPSADTVNYIEGRDFMVDYPGGSLRRTPQSCLPDFRTNVLYEQNDFDHAKFPGFGNKRFFAYVDYSFTNTAGWPVQAPQTKFLKRTRAKLTAGEPLKIIAFGDSITDGSESSTPENIFWLRWVEALKRQYPQARITALNRATPGDTSKRGLTRLKEKVIDEQPDVVLIGFGMNDHNEGKGGVPVPQFERNLEEMGARIRQQTTAEIILYSAFAPNPKWKFGSRHMADYAAATKRVARKLSCAYADVFNNWQMLAYRKKPEDLLSNNINHPGDFGHWIYYRVFCSMGLISREAAASSSLDP